MVAIYGSYQKVLGKLGSVLQYAWQRLLPNMCAASINKSLKFINFIKFQVTKVHLISPNFIKFHITWFNICVDVIQKKKRHLQLQQFHRVSTSRMSGFKQRPPEIADLLDVEVEQGPQGVHGKEKTQKIQRNGRHTPPKFTSWWLNQPHLKNMLVKLDHLPKDPGENKHVWNHHRV